MDIKMSDVTLHIDESISHDEREKFRDVLLEMDGVMAADCHDKTPHLMLIEYNPDVVDSIEFVRSAKRRGMHAELVGF